MSSLPHSGRPQAGVYVRVSSAMQEAEGTSLETQEQRCRAYVAEHGYSLDDAHFYREVYTGVELWDRPQLSRLREAIRRREIDVVVCYAIDRLSRDPVHLGVVISEADHAGVEVLFVTEPLDNTPEGQLIRFVRGYAAKVEHAKIVERMQRGRRARVAAGKPLVSSKPLYGYRWNDDHTAYLPDEPAASVVRRTFQAIASGRTLRAVARELTTDGIPVPSGQVIPWRQTSIAKMLHHPGYKGHAYAYRYEKPNKDDERWEGRKAPKQVIRNEAEWVELPADTIPALVDERTWEAAQRVLTRNKEQAGRQAAHPESHLFRGGFAICGYCGSPMHAGWTGYGKPNYYCGARKFKPGTCSESGTIAGEILDTQAWDYITRRLRHPQIIAEEVRRLIESDPAQNDLTALDRSLSEVSRKQSALIDHLAELDVESAEAVRIKLSALSAQKRQLQEERQQLLDQRAAWRSAQIALDGLTAWCEKVAANLEGLNYEERRLALSAIQVKVKVFKAGHEPRWEVEPAIDLGQFTDGNLSLSASTLRTQPDSRSGYPGAPRNAAGLSGGHA